VFAHRAKRGAAAGGRRAARQDGTRAISGDRGAWSDADLPVCRSAARPRAAPAFAAPIEVVPTVGHGRRLPRAAGRRRAPRDGNSGRAYRRSGGTAGGTSRTRTRPGRGARASS